MTQASQPSHRSTERKRRQSKVAAGLLCASVAGLFQGYSLAGSDQDVRLRLFAA
jgi:hypothetical protein